MFIFTHNIIASAIKVNHIPNIPLQLCLFLQFLPILKIIFIHLLPLYFLWKISLSFTIITSLPLLLDTCFIRHFILRINIIIHFFHLTKVKSQTRVKLQVESGLVGSGLFGGNRWKRRIKNDVRSWNHFWRQFSTWRFVNLSKISCYIWRFT